MKVKLETSLMCGMLRNSILFELHVLKYCPQSCGRFAETAKTKKECSAKRLELDFVKHTLTRQLCLCSLKQ